MYRYLKSKHKTNTGSGKQIVHKFSRQSIRPYNINVAWR